MTMHPPRPGRFLRVAVCLVRPWALVDGLCLDGTEVRAMRRYARWRGRELCWVQADEGSLPDVLSDGRADIAIGGLCRSPELARRTRLVRFGRHRLCAGEPRHSPLRDHVWAVAPEAPVEWASVFLFLSLRAWREGFSAAAGRGTEGATAGRYPEESLR